MNKMQKILLVGVCLLGTGYAAETPDDASPLRTTPPAAAPAQPAAPAKESVVATIPDKDASVHTVPLPAGKDADKVMQSLELGIDLKEPVMKFNDVLLLLGRVEDVSVIVAPELSTPEKIVQKINLTPGRVALRDFLSQVCTQIGATWALDDNGAVVLSAIKKAVITEGQNPAKAKIDADYAGVPLANVASDIALQTTLTITVAEDIRNLPIEISITGWEAERIIKYICNMYKLNYEKTAENAFNLTKGAEE